MARARRHYRRFSNDGHCEQCNERRWYEDDGKRYCRNGHEVEGYLKMDEADDDHFTQMGQITRKQKEVREKINKQLSGPISKELALVCLQVVLRKQVAWLVSEKGIPAELEFVVRDLWDLRIRNFENVRSAKERRKKKGTSEASQLGTGYGSDTETRMYSSQAATDVSDADAPSRDRTRNATLDWAGEDWIFPNIRETLALCYLGCLLLREPVRIGDVSKWAKADEMPFLAAHNLIPPRLRERLPAWAHRLFMTTRSSLEPGDLHSTVTELMLGYKKNWDLTFPVLNVPPLLHLYLKDMALPPPVYPHVEQMIAFLKLDFVFPSRRRKISWDDDRKIGPLDNPDALLAACVVLVTKYIYPLDDVERHPRAGDDPLTLKMDWAVWQEAMENRSIGYNGPHLTRVTANTAWAMTPEQQDENLDWYQDTYLRDAQAPDIFEQLFPLEDIDHKRDAAHQRSQAPISEAWKSRIESVRRAATQLSPLTGVDDQIARIGEQHQRFKYARQLSGITREFYEVAAEVSGLSLDELVRTVYNLEQLLIRWIQKEKLAHRSRIGDDDTGAWDGSDADQDD